MTATMRDRVRRVRAGDRDRHARAALVRLTGVELRKMADTRAGFWLLVTTGLDDGRRSS